MDEKAGWGVVIREFWKNLANGEGGFRWLRLVVTTLFFAGAVWSGYVFKQLVEMSRPRNLPIPPSGNAPAQDQSRLDAMIAQFRASVEARKTSTLISGRILDETNEPFMQARKKTDSVNVLLKDQTKMPPPEVIPPIMFVKALMTVNGESTAIMDIEGEGTGIVVRAGHRFGGAKGRVVSVSANGVKIVWSGKRLELKPGK
jgi:hypothetical protein